MTRKTIAIEVTAMRNLQLLLFGTALLLPTLANAGYSCGRAQIDLGDASTRNGVVSTTVSVDDGNWSVQHTLANGTVIDRSTQYLMIDKSNDNKTQWRGQLAGFPAMRMVGEVRYLKVNGQPVYNEWLYKNGQLIMHSESLCKVDQADDVQGPSS